MKTILFFAVSLCLFFSCAIAQQHIPPDGGFPPHPTPTPRITPTPTPAPTITAAQVFSNTAQTWNFVDGFGHHMTIAPSPIACAFGVCADITVWHYTKDSCAGYWNPRTPEQCSVAVNLDELYFVLRHDPDSAWRCIGFTYIDYTGQKWKVQILQQPGQAPPYTIIPVNSSVSDPDTSYGAIVQPLATTASLTDFAAINSGVNFTSPWRTDASAELLGSLTTLVSFQHEGCVTEKWNFGNGLERAAPIVNLGNGGVCLPLDSRFTMVRIH